jgi:hypothetical protein
MAVVLDYSINSALCSFLSLTGRGIAFTIDQYPDLPPPEVSLTIQTITVALLLGHVKSENRLLTYSSWL